MSDPLKSLYGPSDGGGGGGGGGTLGGLYGPSDQPARATHKKKKKKKGDDHDFFSLDTLKHVITQTPADFVNMALEIPGAAVQVHRALAAADPTNFRHVGQSDTEALEQMAKGMVTSTIETAKHPLRNPGVTLATFLPYVGAGARATAGVSAATRATRAGEAAGAAAKAGIKEALSPTIPDRVIRAGSMEARGHYSRSATGRTFQQATDKGLAKLASRQGQVARRVETHILHPRASKWNDRALRVKQAKANAPGIHLSKLGEKLEPEQLWALRMVAEEVPVSRALAAAEQRAAKGGVITRMGDDGVVTRDAQGKLATRHASLLDLTERASDLLEEGPNGVPVLKDAELQSIYDSLKEVSDGRGEILAGLRLMTKSAQENARLKQAQLRAGGEYVSPVEARKGAATIEQHGRMNEQSLASYMSAEAREADRRVRELDAIHDRSSRRAFAVGTQRTVAERGILGEVGRANRAAEQASKKRYKNAPKAAIGARAHALVRREQRLAQIAWDRFQRGEIGAGKLDRAQRRLAKLTDEYEAHAGPLYAMREAERAGDEAVPEQEATLARLREEEALREREYRQALADETTAKGQLLGAVERQRGLKRTHESRQAHLRSSIERAMAEQLARADRVVGAEDIKVGDAGTFIGSPGRRTRVFGRPVISSTDTLGHTQKMGSLKTSRGANIREAAERTDTTEIVAERFFEAVRYGQLQRLVDSIKGAGTPVPERSNDVFVWTDGVESARRLDDSVRDFLTGQRELSDVPEHEANSILRKIRDSFMEDGNWKLDHDHREKLLQAAEEGRGVFVPRALLGDAGKRSFNFGGYKLVKVFDAINNAQKVALVYAKPSYLVAQGVSNTGMNLIQQGWAYPRNVTFAAKLSAEIGSGYVGVIDELMGQGAVAQAALVGSGQIATASRKIADVMSRSVDVPARRAAFVHEAKKLGYKTPEDFRRLLDDDENINDLVEATQRAKEAIVDYGEMGPFEQNVVRRIIFVYPWQKGATKWAYYFFRDHPAQAAVMAQFSQGALAERERVIGAVPSYMRGVIPIGDNRLINPTAVNPLQTPANIAQAVGGLLSGDPATPRGINFLSPPLGMVAGLATGRDTLDRPLEGTLPERLRDLAIGGVPAKRVISTVAGETPYTRWLQSLLGAQYPSQTFPGAATTDPYMQFLLQGLYPRRYNPRAIEKAVGYEQLNR